VGLCVDAGRIPEPRLRDAIVRELRAPRGLWYAIPRRKPFFGRWLKHGEDIRLERAPVSPRACALGQRVGCMKKS